MLFVFVIAFLLIVVSTIIKTLLKHLGNKQFFHITLSASPVGAKRKGGKLAKPQMLPTKIALN